MNFFPLWKVQTFKTWSADKFSSVLTPIFTCPNSRLSERVFIVTPCPCRNRYMTIATICRTDICSQKWTPFSYQGLCKLLLCRLVHTNNQQLFKISISDLPLIFGITFYSDIITYGNFRQITRKWFCKLKIAHLSKCLQLYCVVWQHSIDPLSLGFFMKYCLQQWTNVWSR